MIPLQPEPWMADAKCRGLDPDLFVPPYNPETREGPPPESLAVCNGNKSAFNPEPPCPVKTQCYDYGKRFRCTGCWGGRALYLGRVRRGKPSD